MPSYTLPSTCQWPRCSGIPSVGIGSGDPGYNRIIWLCQEHAQRFHVKAAQELARLVDEPELTTNWTEDPDPSVELGLP